MTSQPAPKVVDISEAKSRNVDPKGENKKTKGARLLDYLAAVKGIEVFSAPDGKFYVSFVNDEDRLETLSLGSRLARQCFAKIFYEYEQSTIGSQDIQDVIDILCTDASKVKREVFVHMAQADGKIYLDLANNDFDVIEITSLGVYRKKTNEIPVRFIRPKGIQSLPLPVGTPDFNKLKKYLNVKPNDFILVACWLVTCFRTNISLPLLSINGEQGTGKTGFCKFVKQLIDPRFALLTSTPKEERDLMISAMNQWIVAFDNISSIPFWLSDALCRIATGAGFATRQLHTDADEAIFSVRRMVLLNGIGDLATRPDLLRRAVQVELSVIPRERRKEETVLDKEFAEDLPDILLGLLQAVSAGLANLENVDQEFVSTMPDFERWAVACEIALGFDSGSLRARYGQNIENAQSIALENSIVGVAVRELVDAAGSLGWEGQLKILYSELIAKVEDSQKSSFPKRPQDLRQELVRLRPVMRTFGIEIDTDHEKQRKRFIVIKKLPKSESDGLKSESESESESES